MSNEMQTWVPPAPSSSITGHAAPGVVAGGIVIYFFMVLSAIFAVIRVAVRLSRVGRFYLNDYLLVLGSLLASAQAICAIGVQRQGLIGHHIIEVLVLVPERFPVAVKLVLANEFCWSIGIVCIKLSILHLYTQIFGPDRKFMWAAATLATIVIMLGIAAVALTAASCIPFAAYWDRTIPGARCIPQGRPFFATAIANMIVDVLILALPMPKLWGLRMQASKKAGVILLFGIGFGVCGCSAWRIRVIQYYDFIDIFYGLVDLGVSTSLELHLGVIIACIPVIPPAFAHLKSTFQNITSYTTRHTTKSGSGSGPKNLDRASIHVSSKPKITASQIERKNFKRLYNHLYPLSTLKTETELTTRTMGNAEERTEDQNADRKVGGIEFSTTWNVHHLENHV